jgi:hypothetical protein
MLKENLGQRRAIHGNSIHALACIVFLRQIRGCSPGNSTSMQPARPAAAYFSVHGTPYTMFCVCAAPLPTATPTIMRLVKRCPHKASNCVERSRRESQKRFCNPHSPFCAYTTLAITLYGHTIGSRLPGCFFLVK